MAINADHASLLDPLEIIFSCAICAETFSEVYNIIPGRDDASDRDSTTSFSTRLWIADCSHVICAKHFENGGVPIHRAGECPQAPCPLCCESGDCSPKNLFPLKSLHRDGKITGLKADLFVFPPSQLDGDHPDLRIVKLHYLNLVSFGLIKHKQCQNTETSLQKLQKYAANLEQRNTALDGKVKKLDKKVREWQTRIPEINHYLRSFAKLADENSQLRNRLDDLGYDTPRSQHDLSSYNVERANDSIRHGEDFTIESDQKITHKLSAISRRETSSLDAAQSRTSGLDESANQETHCGALSSEIHSSKRQELLPQNHLDEHILQDNSTDPRNIISSRDLMPPPLHQPLDTGYERVGNRTGRAIPLGVRTPDYSRWPSLQLDTFPQTRKPGMSEHTCLRQTKNLQSSVQEEGTESRNGSYQLLSNQDYPNEPLSLDLKFQGMKRYHDDSLKPSIRPETQSRSVNNRFHPIFNSVTAGEAPVYNPGRVPVSGGETLAKLTESNSRLCENSQSQLHKREVAGVRLQSSRNPILIQRNDATADPLCTPIRTHAQRSAARFHPRHSTLFPGAWKLGISSVPVSTPKKPTLVPQTPIRSPYFKTHEIGPGNSFLNQSSPLRAYGTKPDLFRGRDGETLLKRPDLAQTQSKSLNGLSFITEPRTADNRPVYPVTAASAIYQPPPGGQRVAVRPHNSNAHVPFRRSDVNLPFPTPYLYQITPSKLSNRPFSRRAQGLVPSRPPSASARRAPADISLNAIKGARSGLFSQPVYLNRPGLSRKGRDNVRSEHFLRGVGQHRKLYY